MTSRTSYGPALAAVHHQGYGDVARSAAPVIVRLLHDAGLRQGLVIDLGCGSGIFAREVTRRGFEVLGVDPSPAMIRLARKTAPRARFVVGPAESADLPLCAAIVSTGEALTYLAPRQTPKALFVRHARRAARVIPAGGLFVFDAIMHEPQRPMRYRTWREGRDWIVAVDVHEDVHRHVLTRRIIVLTRTGRGWQRSEEIHRVAVYERGWIVDTLKASGFAVRTLQRYGRTPLAPRRMVFVARRLAA